jgi:hypothetical protein
MSSEQTDQRRVPMVVTNNHDQPEARNLLVTRTTTSSIVETTNKYDTVNVQGTRDSWSNRVVYLLSIIGFVVDLGRLFIINFNIQLSISIGNVWRFPTTCYRNGGGAFLIPYFAFLFLVGLPCKFIVSINF